MVQAKETEQWLWTGSAGWFQVGGFHACASRKRCIADSRSR